MRTCQQREAEEAEEAEDMPSVCSLIQAKEEPNRKAAAEAEAKREVLGDLQPPSQYPFRSV